MGVRKYLYSEEIMLLVRLVWLLGSSSLCYGGIANVDTTAETTVQEAVRNPEIDESAGKEAPEAAASNEAVPEDNDTYSMYKQLMSMREEMIDRQEKGGERGPDHGEDRATGGHGNCYPQLPERISANCGSSSSRGGRGKEGLPRRRGVRGGCAGG